MTRPRGPRATKQEEINRLREEVNELLREKYRLEGIIRDMRQAEVEATRRQSFGSYRRH